MGRGMRTLPLALLLGCSDDPVDLGPDGTVAPSGALPELADLDPDPGRFEGELVARPTVVRLGGEDTAMLAYNDQVPGPLVRVRKGDVVVVRFRNELPPDFPTSIHWHGIEGYNASDGTPTTQHLVDAGEGFTYAFVATRPGTYWYHPHHRGAQALFSGLYAPLVVEDPAEDELVARGVLPAAEHVIVLSDTTTYEGSVVSAETDNAMEIMNGTEGRTLLVNGQVDPLLEIPADGARLRIVNTAITRFWRLRVPGHTLVRVGGEGGLLDRARVEGGPLSAVALDPTTLAPVGPATVDVGSSPGEVVLAPGERAEVVLRPEGGEGDTLELWWEDVPRGRHGMWMEGDEMVMGDLADDGQRPGEVVATFRVAGANAIPAAPVEDGTPLLEALGQALVPVDPGEVTTVWTGDDATTLDERMDMWQDDAGVWQMSTWFGMDGEQWTMDHHGGPEQPLSPTVRHVRLGDVVEWEITNHAGMAHPFHFHGFSFQPLSITFWPDDEEHRHVDVPTVYTFPYVEFEDTIVVPGHASVLLRVRFEDPSGKGEALGRWMEHCHILQHGENGMMTEVVVDP